MRQRARVGLVGLAAVVLLIGLASAILSAVNREQPVTAAVLPARTWSPTWRRPARSRPPSPKASRWSSWASRPRPATPPRRRLRNGYVAGRAGRAGEHFPLIVPACRVASTKVDPRVFSGGENVTRTSCRPSAISPHVVKKWGPDPRLSPIVPFHP
ncbi:hypothetical protein AB5I41_28620 [Sphingomonas sp. MMS24-JH45]